MKKQFPTVIHESAQEFEQIYVSGGRIGLSLKMNPSDLARVSGAVFADIRA
jgi:Cys-tRNA(Pro)/Cys-tRNA(Cys) deacylase